MATAITIRRSTPEDCAAVLQLAALDDRRAPRGDAILGFEGDELRAALELDSGAVVADPFYPTERLVRLLQVAA